MTSIKNDFFLEYGVIGPRWSSSSSISPVNEGRGNRALSRGRGGFAGVGVSAMDGAEEDNWTETEGDWEVTALGAGMGGV